MTGLRRLGALLSITGIIAALLAVSAAPAEAAQKSKEDRARETSRPLFAESLRRHRDNGGAHGFTEEKVQTDTLGMTHVRVRQTFDGVPVWGAEAIAHVNADDSVASFTDAFVDQVSPGAGTRPAVSKERAVAEARQASNAPNAPVDGEPSLWIVRHDGGDSLAWQVRLLNTDVEVDEHPSIPVVFVDARNGKAVSSYDDLEADAGTGHSLYTGTVGLTTTFNTAAFELKDGLRGNQAVYNTNHGTSLPGSLMTDTDNVWGDGTAANQQTAAVDAAYAAAQTWDYYKNVHGRNGIWNNGVGARSTVHYSNNYVNAFWNGSQMVYGNGSGNAKPLASLDVGGHEMTHGVTENTAGLVYSGESGGLNEATSDILGTAVEFAANNPADPGDYLIGEKIDVNGDGTPLRYMDKPSKDGASKDCWYSGIGSVDVHYSSGPANHFFYLLAEGSGAKTINGVAYNSPTCNSSTVAGIGRAAAEKIWYRALTSYMTSSTNYSSARTATLNAASDLFGGTSSLQYSAVCAAWAAVSVGTCGGSGGGSSNGTTTVLQNGAPVSNLSGASGSTANFTLAVPAGATKLTFTMSGGSGDADLYVKFGSAPTTSSYACRPYLNGNNETCSFASPSTGTYYVMLHAYSAYSGVSLVGRYSTTNNELVANGGFEGSSSPWALSSLFYIANGNYPHGGTGYIYGGSANSVSQSAYQQITIPSTATGNLTFWLNVSSDETTTSTQYDKLYVEVRNTAGTLLATVATYSNLNKAALGSYSQKSFSLAAYRGQTVRLQFRATTDPSLPTTFRIDDVSVR
jgi:Zn-dependent metalloprotease